jgi:hypothetical protein
LRVILLKSIVSASSGVRTSNFKSLIVSRWVLAIARPLKFHDFRTCFYYQGQSDGCTQVVV